MSLAQNLRYFYCKTMKCKERSKSPALRLVDKAHGVEEKLPSIDHTLYSVAFYLQLLGCRGCGSKCRGLYSPALRLPFAGLLYGAKQLTWLSESLTSSASFSGSPSKPHSPPMKSNRPWRGVSRKTTSP